MLTETAHSAQTYNPDFDRPALLYQQSQQRQWQSDDLPWHLGTRLHGPQAAAGARVLSQILYGERASYRIVGQLLAHTPEGSARRFLLSQLEDEARHVAVFSRYVALLGEETPPNECLAEMVEAMTALPTIEEKLVGMHVLIEGMALETFHAAVIALPDPLLQKLLRRVFLDESRHVAFGLGHIRQLVGQLDRAGRERVAREGGRYAVLSAGLVRQERNVAAEFGLDLGAIQERTLRVLFRRLQSIGLLNALELFGE